MSAIRFLAADKLASWLAEVAASRQVLAPRQEGKAVVFRPLVAGETPSLARATVSPKAAREKAAASQQPAPDLSKAARRLEQRFTDVDFWAEQTAKCLSCGACTYMCPTCQCFNISDEGDPLEGRRLRSWDNCMSPLFTREASGHNPRTAKALRMRNRVSHKYWYAPDYSDGRFACTGCGRCIKQCPVSLDIREIVLNAIADDAEAK